MHNREVAMQWWYGLVLMVAWCPVWASEGVGFHEPPGQREFTIVLLGSAGVGKSAFFMRYIQNTALPERPLSESIGLNLQMKRFNFYGTPVKFRVWDCGHRFSVPWRSLLPKGDAFILFYDTQVASTYATAHALWDEVMAHKPRAPVLFFGNKFLHKAPPRVGVLPPQQGGRFARFLGDQSQVRVYEDSIKEADVAEIHREVFLPMADALLMAEEARTEVQGSYPLRFLRSITDFSFYDLM